MDAHQLRLAEAACRYQLSLSMEARNHGGKADSWNPAFMAQLGHRLLPVTRAKSAINELLQSVAEYAGKCVDEGNRGEAAMLFAMVSKPPDNMILAACIRWARAALPQVTMGHKYAAALMATVVPDDVLEDVRAPWDAFLIQVPNGLVHFVGIGGGRLVSVRCVLVTREPDDGRWSYVAMCEPEPHTISDTIYYQNMNTAKGILNPGSAATAQQIGDLFAVDMEDVDTRSATLLGRLVISTCLAMSDPSNVTPPKPPKSAKARAKRQRAELPAIRTYQLGKPIKIDCRAQVRAYSRGERQPPQVQVLVRGHWKRQPCGPGRTERRVIWIEPYPRGPEDAPINLRAHNLRRTSSP